MSKQALDPYAKSQLIQRVLGRKQVQSTARLLDLATSIPEAFTRFESHPAYDKVMLPQTIGKRLGIDNPYFKTHDAVAGAVTQIAGREYINFSSYNYLGFAGHPLVNKAAKAAIDRYGTSASASRLVSGERPVQQELESELANLYGVDAAIIFVSGHATNVTTLGYLFGPKDLILHDSLIHNSVLEGIRLSGATRRSFEHNNLDGLETLLKELRHKFERVLIVTEGLYSMDGDTPDLPKLISLKQQYKALLMVDEAHALGVLGQTGQGSHEYHGIKGKDVDIWMGTLSKTLASCGGYIAGSQALIDLLKYGAPGFVYSVGLSPVLAATSLAAFKLLQSEPDRVQRLQNHANSFLSVCQAAGVDTGLAEGHAVVPAIVGSSTKATKISNKLFELGVNVQPIIYPAVEERAARLRFFLSAMHTDQQIDYTVKTLASLI